MKVQGRCHCGRISYEATIDPDKVIICHCTDCQTISGAPYRVNVPVLKDNFKLNGEPKLYVKTGGSGNRIVTAFCGDCGAAIYSPPHNPSRGRLPQAFCRNEPANARPDSLMVFYTVRLRTVEASAVK